MQEHQSNLSTIYITTKPFYNYLRVQKPLDYQKVKEISVDDVKTNCFSTLSIVSMNIKHLNLTKYFYNFESITRLNILNCPYVKTSANHICLLFSYLPNVNYLYINNSELGNELNIQQYYNWDYRKKQNADVKRRELFKMTENLKKLQYIYITGILDGKFYRYFSKIFEYAINLQSFKYGDEKYKNDKEMSRYLHDALFTGTLCLPSYLSNLRELKLYCVNWNKMFVFFEQLNNFNFNKLIALELVGDINKFIKPERKNQLDYLLHFKLFCIKIGHGLLHFVINTCDNEILNIITTHLINLRQLYINNIPRIWVPLIDFTKLANLKYLKNIAILSSVSTPSLTQLFCNSKHHIWQVNMESILLKNVICTNDELERFCNNLNAKYIPALRMLKLIDFEIMNCTPIFENLQTLRFLEIIFNNSITLDVNIKKHNSEVTNCPCKFKRYCENDLLKLHQLEHVYVNYNIHGFEQKLIEYINFKGNIDNVYT